MFTSAVTSITMLSDRSAGRLRGCLLCVSSEGTIGFVVLDGLELFVLLPPRVLRRISLNSSSLSQALPHPRNPSTPLEDLHRRGGQHPAHLRERAGKAVGSEDTGAEAVDAGDAREGIGREGGLGRGVSSGERASAERGARI